MDLVRCERYGTTMSRSACDRYLADNPAACAKCEGATAVDGAFDLAGVVPPDPKNKKASLSVNYKKREKEGGRKMAKRTVVCAACGKEGQLVARGLAGCCYHRESKKPGFDAKFPPRPRRAPKTSSQFVGAAPEETIVKKNKGRVDNSIAECSIRFFARDEEIFNWLRDSAEVNRRPLTQEILYRMEGAMRREWLNEPV